MRQDWVSTTMTWLLHAFVPLPLHCLPLPFTLPSCIQEEELSSLPLANTTATQQQLALAFVFIALTCSVEEDKNGRKAGYGKEEGRAGRRRKETWATTMPHLPATHAHSSSHLLSPHSGDMGLDLLTSSLSSFAFLALCTPLWGWRWKKEHCYC